jgi:hypothetical protein
MISIGAFFFVAVDANIDDIIIDPGAFRITFTTGIKRELSQRPHLASQMLQPNQLPRPLQASAQCHILLLLNLTPLAVHLICGTPMIPPSKKLDILQEMST